MKPHSMSLGSGGSTLKGCLPVRRTRSGWRGIQLSGVSLSLSSISLRSISVEWSGDGIVIDPTPDDMLSAEMAAIYGKKMPILCSRETAGENFLIQPRDRDCVSKQGQQCPPELKSVGGGVAENI